jgi:hypothetical protein
MSKDIILVVNELIESGMVVGEQPGSHGLVVGIEAEDS